MLTLLKARIYNDIYQDDRWKYDRREIPDTTLPDDYLLWSGRQFRARIMSLLDSALANPKPLHEARLIDFKKLLKTIVTKYPDVEFMSSDEFVKNYR